MEKEYARWGDSFAGVERSLRRKPWKRENESACMAKEEENAGRGATETNTWREEEGNEEEHEQQSVFLNFLL